MLTIKRPLLTAVWTFGFVVLNAALEGSQATPYLFEWRPFLAPFHSVVLHFPIGFIAVACILELYHLFRPARELQRFNGWILGLCLLTGALSSLFGLMRSEGGGYDPGMLKMHRSYGLAVPVLTVIVFSLHRMNLRAQAGWKWRLAYRSLLLATLMLVTVAGHYGGNLTHGSKYLTENAPSFVREILIESKAVEMTPTSAGSISDKRQSQYADRIQPLLTAKCHSCHGPEKQKGGYRMDLVADAIRGGESGRPAIVPGDPAGSHIVRLILLPRDHDEVMPPDGKKALTADETMMILEWIRDGAVFARDATPSSTNHSVTPR